MDTGRVRAILRSEGIGGLVNRGWAYLLRQSPLAPELERQLGSKRVAQLDCATTLGYWPHISEPRTFNEKILHRMHCTDESVFTELADKYAVREFVRDRVGSEVLTDLYHVTDDPATIPFDELPQQFVLKSTHGSGHVAVVNKSNGYDPGQLVATCEEWLDESYGSTLSEYWYDRIDPRIIVTEYIDVADRSAPRDYKCYVFDGRVKAIHVDHDRFADSPLTRKFYDREWTPQSFELNRPIAPVSDAPPDLGRLVDVAESIGEGLDFARIDLYNPRSGEVTFGEVTLAPAAGQGTFDPVSKDWDLGEQWTVHPPRIKMAVTAD